MGYGCGICGRLRPNEKFSGKGHTNHICKECSKRPKEEIEVMDQKEKIFGFLNQSNISKKNIATLEKLKASNDKEISELASIVWEVAEVKPQKKRRLKFLGKTYRELLVKLEETGLIFAHHW